MNKKFTKAVAIVTLIAMLVTTVVFVASAPFAFAGERDAEFTKMETESFRDFLLENYKDVIPKEKLQGKTIEQMVEILHKEDPYTELFKEPASGDKFYEIVEGEYMGVGITVTRGESGIKIVEVNKTGSAKRAGMHVGDIIIGLDGIDVRNMELAKALDVIKKGKEGTKVSIEFLRDNVKHKLDVVREQIKAESVKSEILTQQPQIGYIKITGFDSDTTKEFVTERDELLAKGAKSFIIDLRNNPGGIFSQGIAVAEQLIPKGKVISNVVIRGKLDKTHYVRNGASQLYPTVVLVNENSASAAEILAAALQDNGIGKLIGTKTYGKGVAQQIVQLDKEKTAKVSVYYFTSPKGNTIDKVGVEPDVLVFDPWPLSEEERNEVINFDSMISDKKYKQGENGSVVLGAQQRLALLGYYKGDLNGNFDGKTADALMKFQDARALYPYPTLDNATRRHLEAAIVERANAFKNEKDYQLERAIKELGIK